MYLIVNLRTFTWAI